MYAATRESANTPNLSLQRVSGLSYKTRRFNSKGAVLTLVWNFAALLFISYSIEVLKITGEAVFAFSLIVYPIAGWLADVYFGRYKVIRCSMWIMCTTAIVLNVLLVVKQYILQYHPQILLVIHIVSGVGYVGLAGFQANAVQFGIDQLIDASSSDISSYISWYVWSYFLSGSLVVLTQKCFCGFLSKSWSFVLFPFFCTLSLVLNALLNQWFIKEPVAHNPLKLIFQVLKYAVKNKYPRLRSAFTYWEDKPFSRIDLAKTKYGGPFTTEQVEDVKTFFRFLAIVGVSSLLAGLLIVLNFMSTRVIIHYRDDHFAKDCETASSTKYLSNCFEREIVYGFKNFIVVVFVPVFEFVLYPLLMKCTSCVNMGIMHKYMLGMFLLLLYEMYILSLEVIGTHMSQNYNVTCLLDAQEDDILDHHVLRVDFKWLIPSQIFRGISLYLILTSCIEFVCAQAPYSMKGLLLGVIYSSWGISIALSYSWLLAVRKLTQNGSVGFFKRNCGVWFYVSLLVFSIILTCICIIIKKCYSPRRRDENVHNEQIFAVNYFDKYLSKTPHHN